MTTNALWYLARASGSVTLILLTIVLVLGITTRAGGTFGALTGRSRLVVTSLHRSTALMALIFLSIHVTTLMFDPYAQLKLIDLIVPFTSDYRPLFVGLGALALDLMVAIVVTSLLRDRLGRAAWRAIHLAAYGLWPIAVIHGIGSGTDHTTVWMIGIDIACVVTVLTALSAHPTLGSAQLAPNRRQARRPSPPAVARGGTR